MNDVEEETSSLCDTENTTMADTGCSDAATSTTDEMGGEFPENCGASSLSHILWLQRETTKLLRMELALLEREKKVAARERNVRNARNNANKH
tara:strand:- start:1117 stop:1395 length:279 start_codon:yes stop_codon:yes gene_type:complete